MRSKIPFGDIIERPVKIHDVVAFYRDSGQLDKKMISPNSELADSYDFKRYDDVKPENMDNPPIQHMSRMLANHTSKEPITHKNLISALSSASSQEPEPASAPVPEPNPEPAPAG